MKLISRKQELEGVYSFIFQPEEPVIWEPGQYMHYALGHPDMDSRGNERWFTISAAPYEQNIMLTTRMAVEEGSSFKRALLELEIGEEVEAEGPKGDFTIEKGDHQHILIAGGIGITPYRSMLVQLAHDRKDLPIELFYANRDQMFIFGEQLKAIEQKNKNFHIRTFIGNERITKQDVAEYVDKQNTIFYISGPRPLVENYQQLVESLKVPAKRIKTDYFPGYN